MKNIAITTLVIGATILNAQSYSSTGISVAESKKEACSKALRNAKIEAMEQAGTVVLSNFNSNIKDKDGKISKSKQSRLETISVGVAKLKHKYEKVSTTQDYQFRCEVDASFDIDQHKFKKALQNMAKKDKKNDEAETYFIAEGYSEDGQSRYKAFTAAKLIAQKNLLEIIKGVDITSLTKVQNGVLETDKIGKIISGTLKNAEVVKREYFKDSRSALVVIKIKKSYISDAIEKSCR